MTHNENLIALTERMRHYQKEYFQHRNSSALLNARKYEREVDKVLGDIKKKHTERSDSSKIILNQFTSRKAQTGYGPQ